MRRTGILFALLLACGVPARAMRPAGSPAANQEDARRFGLDNPHRRMHQRPSVVAEADFRAFNQAFGGDWRVDWDPRTGAPGLLRGKPGRAAQARVPGSPGLAPETAARAFLGANAPFLRLDPDQLELRQIRTHQGRRHLLFAQSYLGIPVEFSRVSVHLDADGGVMLYRSNHSLNFATEPAPSVPLGRALAVARDDLGAPVRGPGELVWFPDDARGETRLAWKLKAARPDARWVYYIDAHDAAVLLRFDELRHACGGVCSTQGQVKGTVYTIDPASTPALSTQFMPHQYVWVVDEKQREVTDVLGCFCSATPGKIFASLQGPYANVSRGRTASAHYDNGQGLWCTISTPISTNHPYAANTNQTWRRDLSAQACGGKSPVVKTIPIFNNFDVGGITSGGSINDNDYVVVRDTQGAPLGTLIGNIGDFRGPAVAGPVFDVQLITDGNAGRYGFDVQVSSYMAFNLDPSTADNATSTFTWTAANTADGQVDEINVFWHINRMHDYFNGTINTSSAAYISRPVNIVSRAGPANMLNAFFDPVVEHLAIGEGNPGKSLSLDGSVVRHEYTHFVIEQIYPINNFGQFGALSEAIADYFSASSLGITTIGSFANNGPALRDLSSGSGCPSAQCKVYPDQWVGQIHTDGNIIGQAMWGVRETLGQSKADKIIFDALFYYPDGFESMLDAMLLACEIEPTCSGADSSAISSKFGEHGITAPGPTGDDLLEPNDGHERATDVSTRAFVSAAISPAADVDFYSLSMAPGVLDVRLTLPNNNGFSNFAYDLYLFDAERNFIKIIEPKIDVNPQFGLCPQSGNCYTTDAAIALSYSTNTAGRYYIAVMASRTQGGTNGPTNTLTPYTLSFSYPKGGGLAGGIVEAKVDNDLLSYDVPVSSFNFEGNLELKVPGTSTSAFTGSQELHFQFAWLRDHALNVLEDTRTDEAGTFLQVESNDDGQGHVKGTLRLRQGFAARYPSVGTVHLEVFGRNHLGKVHSLGISPGLQLTASKAEVQVYNNVFNPARGQSMTVRYGVTEPGDVSIRVYSTSGMLVKTLYQGPAAVGKYSRDWDGRNEFGSRVASGFYVIRMEGGGATESRKVMVVK